MTLSQVLLTVYVVVIIVGGSWLLSLPLVWLVQRGAAWLVARHRRRVP